MPARPLPVISDTFRVVWKWSTTSGQTAVNVLNVFSTSKTAADIAAIMDANADSSMFAAVADSWSVGQIDITPLDGTSAQESFVPATPTNWDGGTGGDWAPAVASIVSIRTGVRGPKGRGRVYLPGTAESAMSDGSWTSNTDRATCEAAWIEFAADLEAVDIHMGVASYLHEVFYAATSLFVETQMATQRRRQSRLRT